MKHGVRMVAPLVVLILASMGGLVSATSSFSDGSADYHHPYPTGLEPGDILFGHSPDVSWLIPGY